MYSEKFYKFYKAINESIACNVPDLFYLKSTQREPAHTNTPRSLENSGTQKALNQLPKLLYNDVTVT